MTLKVLIENLKEVEEKYGDIDVVIGDISKQTYKEIEQIYRILNGVDNEFIVIDG
jgi:hypothetical protein